MVGYPTAALVGDNPGRAMTSVLIGLVADRVRGRWNSFRAWLRYHPERHYMRGRPAF